MPYVFKLHRESVKRKFAVYVVVAKGENNTKLYVGKTGDNREGCNPLISRCGNHFSYNEIHSQVRNKLDDHEDRDYVYVFEHFDDYVDDEAKRRLCIDNINEMERWLNQEIQSVVCTYKNVDLLNGHRGTSYIRVEERKKRAAFRTEANRVKISALVAEVVKQLGNPA